MALGRSFSFAEYGQNYSESSSILPEICSRDDGSEITKCLQKIGRKRIRVLNRSDMVAVDLRRHRKCLKSMASTISVCDEKSLNLEALPRDILVWILCGVEYDDLKQLFLVSKAVREAALIAKESYFVFSTPRQNRRPTSSPKLDEIEAPNAPIRRGHGKTRTGKKFAAIAVNLFPSTSEDLCTKFSD